MDITQPPGKTVWSFDVKLTTTRENRIGKQADIGVGYKAFRGSKHISGITGQFRSFIKDRTILITSKWIGAGKITEQTIVWRKKGLGSYTFYNFSPKYIG